MLPSSDDVAVTISCNVCFQELRYQYQTPSFRPFTKNGLSLSVRVSKENMNAAMSMGSKKGLIGTFAADAGELKLRAYVISGPTLNVSDVSLSIEKPGSFLIDFDVPQQVLQPIRTIQKIKN